MEDSEIKTLLKYLLEEIRELKTKTHLDRDWMTREQVMKFLDYGATQLAKLEKSGKIRISQIGRRRFYSIRSIMQLLDQGAWGGPLFNK